jgi:hypothetical protein
VIAQHDGVTVFSCQINALKWAGTIFNQVSKTPDLVGITVSVEDGLQGTRIRMNIGDQQNLHRSPLCPVIKNRRENRGASLEDVR